MNAAVEAVLADRELDHDAEELITPTRPREKFRMSIPGQFKQIRKRPASFNGIHRRRRKKIRI
jgi:hypothetical protein